MKLGDQLTYHSFSSGPCKATVMGLRSDGTIDIDVDTGAREPLRLTKVSVALGSFKPKAGECTLNEGGNNGEEIKASA